MNGWHRVRYDDQGADLGPAVRMLDRIAQAGCLEALWIARRGSLALLVCADQEREALLVEGLINTLPGARLTRERSEAVEEVLNDFPSRYTVSGAPVDGSPPVPGFLLALGSDAALHLKWVSGRLAASTLYARERRQKVGQTLRDHWPRAGIPLMSWPMRLNLLPSQVLSLPPSREHPTLASRNVHERAFANPHEGPLLLGCDMDDQGVSLSCPMRLVWVGSPARVDAVCSWMTQRWTGRMLVLDGSGEVGKGWQDVSQAVMVSWASPGRSAHINPLARLPGESDSIYVDRAMAWLAGLGISQSILGARVTILVRAMVRLLVSTGAELHPMGMLGLLNAPQGMEDLDRRAVDVLPEEELATWRARDWRRDAGWLTPAVSILRGLFDRTPEMALWMPPYTSIETVLHSRWVIFRVPTHTANQRTFWAGVWPLLLAAYGHDDVLAFALGLGSGGARALELATGGGASVLAWGSSLLDAVGIQDAKRLSGVDLMVGAGGDPAQFAPVLRVPPQILAAQADDQAMARLGGDVGSVRFRLPAQAARMYAGWPTANGMMVPPLASVLGDEEAAAAAVVGLIKHAKRAGKRILILGTKTLWPALQAELPDALLLGTNDLPMLNPLSPRPKNAFPWVWWASGLGLPAVLVQGAFQEGCTTLQGLLDYVQKHSTGNGHTPGVTALREAVQTGLFGEAESDPRTWFAEAPVIAVESVNAALTRTLMMAALEAGARLVCWQAPGVAAGDISLLKRTHCLLFPDEAWSPVLLVTRISEGYALAALPDHLQEKVRDLLAGEAFLYWRGRGHVFSRLVLEAHDN